MRDLLLNSHSVFLNIVLEEWPRENRCTYAYNLQSWLGIQAKSNQSIHFKKFSLIRKYSLFVRMRWVEALSNVRILPESYKFILKYGDWCWDLHKDCELSKWTENLTSPEDPKDVFSGKISLISGESFKCHFKGITSLPPRPLKTSHHSLVCIIKPSELSWVHCGYLPLEK